MDFSKMYLYITLGIDHWQRSQVEKTNPNHNTATTDGFIQGYAMELRKSCLQKASEPKWKAAHSGCDELDAWNSGESMVRK